MYDDGSKDCWLNTILELSQLVIDEFIGRKKKKMKMKLFVTATFYMVTSTCILPSPLTLQLILEFAKWKGWDQIVLFENFTSLDCVFMYTKPLIACLSNEGIAVSIQSAVNPNIPDALAIQKHRIGSIVLLDGLNLTSPDNVLHVVRRLRLRASQKFQFNYYVSWLMITMRNTDATIDTVLRHLNIGIDSDVIVATPSLTYEAIQEMSRTYWNSSLVTNFLGSWCLNSWSLNSPISVKLRNEFKGQPIVFGVLNGTIDRQMDANEEEANDIAPLLDFANFVTSSVNASIELISHEKLGTLNNKVWNNLLGDVVTGEVDIGLGYITVNKERQAEMSFSHPLIRYMRNIYYHPLETGTMRDIFRQPFNNCLLSCVASTYFAILVTMGLIIYAAKTVLHNEEANRVEIGEAALWCISIMCMQGSAWTPWNPSGKTVLLFSLMFALVTYSAYAGFITSILSVQATGIKSITDILSHNFELGYSITDDEYIRNVNDSNLRQLYIRAYNSRESKLDTTSGLTKAVKGHYGFFVSATLARRALRSTLIQERCTLKELPLPQTFTMVALPMANSCPYKKIINLNILKIRERGVLNRITERMLPEMPRCKSPTTFHSARLADVYSAFFILIAGSVSAVSIWVVERIWHKRRQMKETIVRGMRQHHLMPSHLPHLPHLPRFSHLPHLPHLHSREPRRTDFSNDEHFPSSSAVSAHNSRVEIVHRKNQEHYTDLDEEIDQPCFEPKFFSWRKRNNFKRAGLSIKMLDRNQKSNTTFPFHQ
ncbi:hypothetical protein E2986_00403 [Frieseomelitta varia]|uniref:Uncharacterized protein n=1 Tax=Frieseomelitta varia TaxID=561572 RepID=A0A833W7R3_9HYME|nr:hypothetical protein E2986_00403 [Frieseomelitta varia]